jgi:hypothetical protein
VLGQLSGEEEANSGLDISGGKGVLLYNLTVLLHFLL